MTDNFPTHDKILKIVTKNLGITKYTFSYLASDYLSDPCPPHRVNIDYTFGRHDLTISARWDGDCVQLRLASSSKPIAGGQLFQLFDDDHPERHTNHDTVLNIKMAILNWDPNSPVDGDTVPPAPTMLDLPLKVVKGPIRWYDVTDAFAAFLRVFNRLSFRGPSGKAIEMGTFHGDVLAESMVCQTGTASARAVLRMDWWGGTKIEAHLSVSLWQATNCLGEFDPKVRNRRYEHANLMPHIGTVVTFHVDPACEDADAEKRMLDILQGEIDTLRLLMGDDEMELVDHNI